MKVLIIGDTHGNAGWLRQYVYLVAVTVQADAIVQLGDFGAWEHTREGVEFMDRVGDIAQRTGIPLYWLHGNHDKHSHTTAAYRPDQRGFLACRDFVYYIPQGHSWTWDGVTMRSFGGAYSIDKKWRIEKEQRREQPGTLWFPEEEMTDSEMAALLDADSSPKDIIFSHDKPYSAKPDWNRKNLTECIPNQMRLERALRAHQPALWFHGHLHYHYLDTVFSGDYKQTTVIGLEPDNDAAEPGWRRTNTWALLELDEGNSKARLGPSVHLPQELMNDARAILA